MQSKKAINNLINRYRAVLKKCHMLNNFGTLLKRGAIATGFVAVLASPMLMPSATQAFQLICDRSGAAVNCYTASDQADYFLLEPEQSGQSYARTMSLPGSGAHGLLYKNPADPSKTYSNINDLLGAIIPQTQPGRYVIGQGALPPAGSIAFTTDVAGVTTPYYVTPLQTPSESRLDSGLSADITGGAFYNLSSGGSGTHGGAILNENINGGYNITADFFANTADYNGGAFYNYASGTNAQASIGDITASFIANKADDAGGAFYNYARTNATASIGHITASFIANTAKNFGGAFYNYAGGIDSTARIGDITASFIANTAGESGGAFYNVSYGGSTASIGDINASFIANTAVFRGGAFYNYAGGDNSKASIGDITASFIANTAGNYGGAFYNQAYDINAIARIGNINATFIANTAKNYGGALYNDASSSNSTASIGDINATFIANTALYGGALYNTATGTNAKASIGGITASFIANTANRDGGALYNIASSSDATAKIGTINADFIDNIADSDNNDTGLGGAIWTNRSLNFLADSKTNIFSGNRDSIDYNAIYIEDTAGHNVDLALNFAMQSTGSFMLNDSITTNVPGAYDVNITGQDASKNIFYLNNAIKGADNVNVSAATLRLGTVNHAGTNFMGAIHANNTHINNGGVLEVAVGKNNTANITGNANFNDGSFLVVSAASGTGANFALTATNLNVADSAKLLINDAKIGDTVNVATGTFTITANQGWHEAANNLQFDNPFLQGELMFPAATQATVAVSQRAATSIMPNIDSGLGGLIDLGIGNNVNSAGTDFIKKAASLSNKDKAAAITEGGAQLSNVVGVASNTVGAAKMLSGALVVRNTVNGASNEVQQIGALTLSEEGVSAGSAGSGSSDMKNGIGVWLTPLYKQSSITGFEAGNFSNDFTVGLGGLALGADYTFNHIFRLGLALNIGAGYSESSGDFDGAISNFDFWGISAYGAYMRNNFTAMIDVGYTGMHSNVDQNTSAGSLETNINSHAWTVGLTGEYVWKTSALDITPHVGVRFMSITTNAYDANSAAGSAFSVESDTQNVWYFPVGATLSKDIDMENGWHVTPKLDLGFIAAAGDLESTATTSIAGVAGSTDLTMQNVDGLAFNGGVGLEVVKDDFSMGFNYNLLASEHETGHMLSATFKYAF